VKESYVSRVEINGFRSIKSCGLKLRELNVVIGSNGGGKTNFIDFFQLVNNIFDGTLQDHVTELGGPDAILRFGRKFTPQMSAGLSSAGGMRYGFTLSPTPDDRMIFTDEYILGEGPDCQSIGSGHFETQTRRYEFKMPRIKCRVFHFQDLGRASAIMRPRPLDEETGRLAHDAGNLSSYLYYLRENYHKYYCVIVKRIQVVAPYFVDFHFEVFRGADNREMVEMKWLERGCGTPHSARNLSTGTLLFACLMTALKSPPEIRDDIIVLDEPDLNLHPTGLRILANILKVAKNYTQIIISTNSSEMLNQFDVEDVVVADRSGGDTVLYRVDRDEIDEWAKYCTLSQIWENNIIGGRPTFNPGNITLKDAN
jgi:predicted ATPase